MLLDLLDEIEQIPVAVKVIRVAANGVKNPHKPGVGVHFTDAGNVTKDKIETHLVGAPGAFGATATM